MKEKGQRWMMVSKRNVVLESFDFEPVLKPREVALRVQFTAVSPGTECANYLALDPDTERPGTWCSYPWVPGYSGISEVIGVGSAVTEYKPGDRVVGSVSHATHAVANVDGSIIPANPATKPEQAAWVHLLNIAYTALQVLQTRPLETAAVWGLGTIGNLVSQILNLAGYRVAGIDPVAARRRLAERCGIRLTFDPTSPDFAAQMRELTHDQGYDVTVDTTGHPPTTISLPGFTRNRGQMVLMTHWRSQTALDASDFIHTLFVKGISLIGGHVTAVGSEPGTDRFALQRRKMAFTQQCLADGRLQVQPLISHVVKPAQCREVYEGLCFDKDKWWGVVVDWSGNH